MSMRGERPDPTDFSHFHELAMRWAASTMRASTPSTNPRGWIISTR
ncbi:MAG: hypothetical protein QM661_09160 [Solimonas sp.]